MEIKGSDISGLSPQLALAITTFYQVESWSPCQEVMQMAMMMIRGPNLQSSHELKTQIPAGILWQNPQQNLLNNTLHVSLQIKVPFFSLLILLTAPQKKKGMNTSHQNNYRKWKWK